MSNIYLKSNGLSLLILSSEPLKEADDLEILGIVSISGKKRGMEHLLSPEWK